MSSGGDLAAAKKLIAKSGNNFHSKVFKALESAGWTLSVSPFYLDHATYRSREIDLIGERFLDAGTDINGRVDGSIQVRLIVECKYVPKLTVFWTHIQRETQTKALLEHSYSLPANNMAQAQHHYLKGTNGIVAKLFESDSGGKARDTDQEPIYKALNQCIHAMISFRGQYGVTALGKGKNVRARIAYPIVMVRSFGDCYSVRLGDDSDPVPITDNFVLEVNYSHLEKGSKKNEYILIDVVSLDTLDSYLATLDADVDVLRQQLSIS